MAAVEKAVLQVIEAKQKTQQGRFASRGLICRLPSEGSPIFTDFTSVDIISLDIVFFYESKNRRYLRYPNFSPKKNLETSPSHPHPSPIPAASPAPEPLKPTSAVVFPAAQCKDTLAKTWLKRSNINEARVAVPLACHQLEGFNMV